MATLTTAVVDSEILQHFTNVICPFVRNTFRVSKAARTTLEAMPSAKPPLLSGPEDLPDFIKRLQNCLLKALMSEEPSTVSDKYIFSHEQSYQSSDNVLYVYL